MEKLKKIVIMHRRRMRVGDIIISKIDRHV